MTGIPKLLIDENARLTYYLLYANYGNSHIAGSDEQRFKYKLFTTIFQYGATWQSRLNLQAKLRKLESDPEDTSELFIGSTQIYNHSYNPSSAPSTQTLEELNTINEQTAQKNKRDKLTAYANLMGLLDTDVTGDYINKFKELFLKVVQPEQTLVYGTRVTDVPDDSLNADADLVFIDDNCGSLYGNAGSHRTRTFTDIYPDETKFMEDYNL